MDFATLSVIQKQRSIIMKQITVLLIAFLVSCEAYSLGVVNNYILGAPGSDFRPHVIIRPSWGARPIKRAYTENTQFELVIHHTAGKQDCTIRSIQELHQNTRGWNDIAYHFLIRNNGDIIQGRPDHVQGGHLHDPYNKGRIGISIIGNYEERDKLSKAASSSLVYLLAYLICPM